MTLMSPDHRSSPRPSPPSFLSGVRWEHLAAGVSGGLISTCVLHPLDLLKIRFAVNEDQWKLSRSSRPSYLPSAVAIVRGEGLRGLYQGLTPNMIGAGSAWGFYFLFYNAFKSSLQEGNTRQQLTAAHHLLAASASGVLTLSLTNPVWVVKTRLCLQGQSQSTRLYSGFRKPNSRLVSTRLISREEEELDPEISHMVMQWGQFLDHDLDHSMEAVSRETFREIYPGFALIGRELHFIVMLRQLFYAIKNQLKAPRGPNLGHFLPLAGSL